jgi:hypothetical protein
MRDSYHIPVLHMEAETVRLGQIVKEGNDSESETRDNSFCLPTNTSPWVMLYS